MKLKNKIELRKMIQIRNFNDTFIWNFDEKDKKKLTDEDIEKLKILKSLKKSDEKIYWEDLKKIILVYSIENLMLIKSYAGKGVKWIVGMIKNNLDFEEVIKLFKKYPIRTNFIQKLISSTNYTLQQIEFLLKHNMIYYRSLYHTDFDYIELYNELIELKLNPEEEYVNQLSIDMIKNLKKLYETEEVIEEIYDTVVYYLHNNEIEQFFKFIALHKLTLNEIKLLFDFKKGSGYSVEKLNLLFDYYSKEEIFKKILNFE